MKSSTTPFLYALAATAALPAAAQIIDGDDPSLVGFATGVVAYLPAPAFSSDGTPTPLTFQDESAATGAPDFSTIPGAPFQAGIVSLGDAPSGTAPGSITLSFDQGITDGAGADFAVFSNSFTAFNLPGFVSADLAFVEVSTDGNTFARLTNTSTNTLPDGDPSTPLEPTDIDSESFGRSFATLNPDNVSGIAGTAAINFGDTNTVGNTFDLATIATHALVLSGAVDLNNVQFVRLVDIPGDGRAFDSFGNPIFDALSPGSLGGGFELDAIGVINQVPEPTTAALLALGALAIARRRRA